MDEEKVLYWNDIYEAAIDKGINDDELDRKDEARFQVGALVIKLGYPDFENTECPEDAVEYWCDKLCIEFDEYGNIIKYLNEPAKEMKKWATEH